MARLLKSLETLLQAEPSLTAKALMIAAGVALTLVMATLRLSVEAYLAVSLAPLLPTIVIAWYMGTPWGLGMAVFVVLSWLTADLVGTTPAVPYWVVYVNSTVRASVLGLTALLVAALRSAYRRQLLLATTDPLTGLANRRHFMTMAEAERRRAARFGHPVTLAFLDLDGFKAVNDRLGHAKGDEVLRLVGGFLRRRMRSIDCAARLGGDEFVLLLPETGEQAGLRTITDVRQGILATLSDHGYPVGLSAGGVTFVETPGSVDEMLRGADRLMYQAKQDGGGFEHSVVSIAEHPPATGAPSPPGSAQDDSVDG